MRNIRWGYLLLGGFLAGLLILGKDFYLHHNILLPHWHAAISAGHFHQAQAWFRPIFALEALLEGVLLAWLYALARPRLGPGPKTAVITGVTGGLLVRGVASIDQLLWLPLPSVFPITVFLIGVLTSVCASLLAGWIYKEN